MMNSIDTAALVSDVSHGKRTNSVTTEGTRNSSRTCYHCGAEGHVKKNCWKLHGRPPQTSGQFPPRRVANTVIQDGILPTPSTVTISVDEYARLQQLSLTASSATTQVDTGNPAACLSTSSRNWVIDSGATDHMTGNESILDSFTSSANQSHVTLANGSTASVNGLGTTTLSPNLSLSSVLYLSQFPFNLISVSQIIKALNCCVIFFPTHCLFQDLGTKQIIGKGRLVNGLYVFESLVPRSVACTSSSLLKVHCQFGHPSLSVLQKMCPSLSRESVLECEACQFAKHHRTNFLPRINKSVESSFDLVHTDVWGPCPVVSKLGHRYFVTFVDDFSRVTWLYPLKSRSDVFTAFCTFHAEIQTQFNKNIRILRSDNAKDYLSSTFQTYLSRHGILHHTSCPYTPQQNGVAERKNRHLLEVARALIFHMGVPKPFWVDAVSTACYLINRMPSSVLNGQIPYSVLFPSHSLFSLVPRVFGCTCFVQDMRSQVSKLDPKSIKCVFLGYSWLQKGN
ncbi:unnamed protein product [Cuscuta europaea]|uniref:Retrovirus-related Pol polyprotein from transposon TNT 1-94 n=1 Tax=Cuscuta europaea TaxID=41803 RepID=A0A9P0ZA75_CUSEU|nr:unnamed protein product [Cuscuta europaea]